MLKKSAATRPTRKTKKVTAARARKAPTRKAGNVKSASRPGPKRPADAKREEYAKALGLYEQALQTLQRGRTKGAATLFRRIIDKYPDERELHERSHRYLEVCHRQSAPEPAPKTLEERVYAATLALNSGAQSEALSHLEAALAEDPNSDHVQYMLAVARAGAGETAAASTHLHRALELNPDNRFLARNEPSFDVLRDDAALQPVLGARSNVDSAGG